MKAELENIKNLLQKAIIAIDEILKIEDVNMPVEDQNDVLTFVAASEYLGISKSTLYKLTSGRKIPHYKPSGKLIYFHREDLEKWVLSNRIAPQTEIEEIGQSYCMKNPIRKVGSTSKTTK